MSDPRPTLQTIAKAAGVSCSAVSRALRNHPSIPPSTCERIRRLADELGYRPNPLVSALMAAKRSARPVPAELTLGLLTNHDAPRPWEQGRIVRELYDGLISRAEQRGYRLEEFWMRAPGMTARRVSQILYQRGIPGVIVGPLPVAHGHVRLEWKHLSAVAIGYSAARPVLHRVISHHVHAMQLAVRRLRHAGFHRIGLAMLASENSRVEGQWLASFLYETRGFAAADQLPPFVPEAAHWTRGAFAKWFERCRPEAIVCVHPETVAEWLSDMRVELPGEVCLVDLYRRTQYADRFAGVDHNAFHIGVNAIDLLVDLIHMNERGLPAVPKTVLVEPGWRDGESLHARPEATGGRRQGRRALNDFERGAYSS